MALTSTSRGLSGLTRRAAGAAAAITLAAGAMLAFAAPASAHTPVITAECSDGVSYLEVHLTNYQTEEDNLLSVIIDGEIILDDEVFGESFHQVWELDSTEAHEYEVDVFAYDDPDYQKDWSVNVKGTIEECVGPTTTVEPTTTTEPTATEPTTTTPAESSTSEVAPTTAPAGGSSGGLADTGASIAVPIVLGVLMLVGGGALLLLVRRRGASGI